METTTPPFISICGTKNSGKTTLITKLISKFKNAGFKIGTIKHDMHGFDLDNVGSDTDKHKKSGAIGTLIVSNDKFMLLKEKSSESIFDFLNYFNDCNLIILEGYKNESYPKIEIIRKEISSVPVSNKENLLFYVTDVPELLENEALNTVDLNDIDSIYNLVVSNMQLKIDKN